VGKTTTAVHLAAALGRGALLVDGDPNASAAAWHDRSGGRLPFELRSASEHFDSEKYKHIVIDTPARPNPADLKTISENSDLIIVPSFPDTLSLDALVKIVNSFNDLKIDNYRVLLTQTLGAAAARDAKLLLSDLGIKFFGAEIRRRVVFGKAATAGSTVNDLRDGGDSWTDILNLKKEVLKNAK
jgi:chromosome partitioning protein